MDPLGKDGRHINGGNHYANADTIESAREWAGKVAGTVHCGYDVAAVSILGRLMEFRGDCWYQVRVTHSETVHPSTAGAKTIMTVLKLHDPEPGVGAVVKLRLKEGAQQIWESSAENVGGWCTTAAAARFLGSGYLSWFSLMRHAESLGATVVLLSESDESTFRQGWSAGRQDLLSDITGYVHDRAAEPPHDLATLTNDGRMRD